MALILLGMFEVLICSVVKGGDMEAEVKRPCIVPSGPGWCQDPAYQSTDLISLCSWFPGLTVFLQVFFL